MYKTRRTADRIENVILGATIKRLREQAGLSQREVERLLGKGKWYMGSVERGTSYPEYPTLVDISRILRTNVVELIAEVERETEAHYKATKHPRPFEGD